MATSTRHTGWRSLGPVNNRTALLAMFNNTEVFRYTGSAVTIAKATAVTGGISATTGDVAAVAGNVKINSPGAFGTTQPVGAAIFMVGTAPAGTITTGGAIFTDGTTMKKIIAANTVSDIQT